MRAAKAQTAENIIDNLLVTMGLRVDEGVSRAIAALLNSNSHIVAGVLENSVAVQELELTLDQAVFSALERGDLPTSEVRRVTSAVNISKDLVAWASLPPGWDGRSLRWESTRTTKTFPGSSHWPLPCLICAGKLCAHSRCLILSLARNAVEGEAAVDTYRDYVLRGLIAQEPHVTDERDLHIIFASRCLEQIADNAAHLAEDLVVFLEDHNHHESGNSHRIAS